MLALGATPIDPAAAAARSERMSPKRLDATMTSIDCGRRTRRAARASIRTLSTVTPGRGVDALLHDFVPERHRVDDPVGLRRGDESPLTLLRELGRVRGHPLDTRPGEDRLLDGHLFRLPAIHPPADLGVLPLDVLTDDDEVEPVDARERRAHSRQEPDGSQVHVLLELPADRDQQSPQGHVVGDVDIAHRAQQDRVARGQLVEAVDRHHPSVRRGSGPNPTRGSASSS